MSESVKDHITCQVVDTLTERPAAGLHASLQCSGDNKIYYAVTNSNGRVTSWPCWGPNDRRGPVTIDPTKQKTIWTLRFDTRRYFGRENTVWPRVEVTVAVKPDGLHYHVPLRLGPHDYMTSMNRSSSKGVMSEASHHDSEDQSGL